MAAGNLTPQPAKAPLRVGLMIDSYTQPRWRYKIIAEIVASPVASLALIIMNGDTEAKAHTPEQKIAYFLRQRPHLLYKLYTRLDDKLFGKPGDPFENVDIQPLLAGVPVMTVKPIKKKFTDDFSDEDHAAIARYDLDVALRFGFRIVTGNALRVAKHGVWSHHHGDNLVYRGGPPGFWEVMRGDPFTGTILQVLSEELDGGKVIYRSFAETDMRSVRRNANNYYWQSVTAVASKLRDLHEHGPCALKDPLPAAWTPYSSQLFKAPTNTQMIGLLSRFAARYARFKITDRFYFDQWFMAYKINPKSDAIDDTLYKFKRLVPPKDRFWADPFPLKKDGKYYIFFEELIYKNRKGHLSVMEVDRKGIVDGPHKILERPYHLSYPFVFGWNGELYMIPETGKARTVELYRCISFPKKWEFDRVLLSDIHAADSTLAEIEGQWWMFTSVAVDGARDLYELHLYHAETPLGPWKAHRFNPVKADVRSSRSAGRIFKKDGDYYRPAQQGLGFAMSINRIERLDPEGYLESEVCKILPDWAGHLVGTHTFNSADGLTVIDGQVQRRRYFGGRGV